MTNDKCKNCGADYGLHHALTDQCPFGGVEAPIGKVQEWKTSTYRPTIADTYSTPTLADDCALPSHEDQTAGLTKREYFAACAMQGMFSSPHWTTLANQEKKATVQLAVLMADALIIALNNND